MPTLVPQPMLSYDSITNFLKFDSADIASAKAFGRYSDETRDIELTVEVYQSLNPRAPVHHVFTKTPKGFKLQIGSIWRSRNMQQGVYFQISLPRFNNFRGNLGAWPKSDDKTLFAIIPWSEKNF